MELVGKIIPVAIEDEIKESYLTYAMSVIVSRALPDVRDGLKPVHRRILYSMSEMGLRYDRPFKKCGRIVGDVLGKFHPHGDQSIYDALVRLAQDFSMRYPLIRGQGNFGSVDGDPAAAMRYTEAKLERLAEEMLKDIKKETVDFGLNYDDSMKEPLVLPAALPCLLINGASGIAVGMATAIPPHNLVETCNAVGALIDNPGATSEDLMEHILGPDFPTGGIIFGKQGIREAYCTGRGKITVRARISLETTKNGKDVIIVTELPYMVNKATLLMRIADMARDKKIDGISDLRDESDRKGMRIVIELKRGAIPKVVLNRLFSHTAMQQNFNVNALAIVDGVPKLLTLRDMLWHFVQHRKEVVVRRSQYELKKARERAHILAGLKIALDNIDNVIQIIKSSKNVDIARTRLMDEFALSERQALAILDMRLQRLTSLETQKVLDELAEIRGLIAHLEDLLSSEEKIYRLVKEEVLQGSEKFGDNRGTEIVPDEVEKIDIEDMITKEDMVVLISNKGFIKRIPVSAYKKQGRGGKGSSSAKLRNEDFLEHLFIASTHDYILFVSSEGKAYWLKVHEIPEGTRASRGAQVKSLVSISANEEITTIVSLQGFQDDQYILMATRRGIVKKAATSAFVNAKTRGIIAIKLDDGDRLVSALAISGNDEVVLVSHFGYALRFHEENVRKMGRATRGVQGIRLQQGDELTEVMVVKGDEDMILVSEYGYGKRIDFDNFIPHGRGTRGQIAYKIGEKTGILVGAKSIYKSDELICITSQGNTVKLDTASISKMGKNAQGVRVVNIEKPDFLVGIARVASERDEEA